MTDTSAIEAALRKVVERFLPEVTGVNGLLRLSGGASQETWSFDAVERGGRRRPLILRRAPGGVARPRSGNAIPLEMEAQVIRRALEYGVMAPGVPYILTPEDGLGSAYIMDRIEGETIARKILRDDAFAAARPKLAHQCGEALAKLQQVPVSAVNDLPLADAKTQWQSYRDLFDSFNEPKPVFELAFRWLEERMPSDVQPVLVHGDFRHGNLLIGPDGLRAVLDWELTHIGDSMEDFGWICVNSWRFGVSEKPVGGFGYLEDLIEGYEAAGGPAVDPERIHFWQVFGTLKWGIMCMIMVSAYREGDRSVERATIGRRSSETEIDLINLLTPRA